MAYDKDTVRKANKAGVFDHSIDASILEIDHDERLRMGKEIEGINHLDVPADVTVKGRPRSRKQKLEAKERVAILRERMTLNIWDKFMLWFKGLFGGSVSQFNYLNKKELKRAKVIIQNFSPMFYDFKDPTVVKPRITREFGKVIYSLYKTYMKLYLLFEDSVIDEDHIDVDSDSFFVNYETELLSDKAQNIIDRLNKDRIVELYEHHDNAKIQIERELTNLKNYIEASDSANVETYSLIFEAILLLRKLDFTPFFKLFDRNFIPSLKYNPSFKGSVFANEIRHCSTFIRDLDRYLHNISKIDFPENVGIYFDSIMRSFKDQEKKEQGTTNDHDGDSSDRDSSVKLDMDSAINSSDSSNEQGSTNTANENEDKKYLKYTDIDITARDIKYFLKTVKSLVRSGVIESMVKYIYKDSMYQSVPVPVTSSFFEKYLKVINYKILKLSDMSESIVKERNLKENIRSLFKVNDGSDTNINFIGNYNPLVNKKLEDINLKTFEHPKSIALIKMFFEKHYFKYMKDCIDKLVVEGEFSDKTEGSNFSNDIYEIEDDRTELHNFVKEMTESDSIKNLLRGIGSSNSLDSSQKNMLSNKINDINTYAQNIVESVLPKLLNIQLTVDKALEDSKSRNPNFIYNIKTINGLGNKAYMVQLSNLSVKIRQFLDIMKNYHLVRPTPKKR